MFTRPKLTNIPRKLAAKWSGEILDEGYVPILFGTKIAEGLLVSEQMS